MKSAALTNGSGPGSSISLSPESIRVRDAIIEKFIDKSLDDLNYFLASALDTEKDESKRIGILAARVYILRTRISKIMQFNQNSMIPAIDRVTPQELINSPQNAGDLIVEDEPKAEGSEHLEEWNELMTMEDGEINGVRIPRGVAITVGKEDAARLIGTGKAELITEEEMTEIQEPSSEVTTSINEISEEELESGLDQLEQMPAENSESMLPDEEGHQEKEHDSPLSEEETAENQDDQNEPPFADEKGSSDIDKQAELDDANSKAAVQQEPSDISGKTEIDEAVATAVEQPGPSKVDNENVTDETETKV